MAAPAVTGANGTPYVGNRPFRGGDSGRFLGRSRESRELAALWENNRVTILWGPSGVGKSSLLCAGVIPRIVPSQADIPPVGRLTRGAAFPLAALPEHNPHTLALLATWSPGEPETRLSGLTIQNYLHKRGVRADPYDRPLPLMAAIDQVEDLFTGAVQGDRRKPFFDELAEALEETPNLHLLLSVRDDYLEDLEMYMRTIGYEDIVAFNLGALSLEGASEAVLGPLKDTGRQMSVSVVETLIDAVRTRQNVDADGEIRAVLGSDVDPAMLQVICAEFWATLPDDVDKVLPQHLLRCGGVGQLVSSFLDQALSVVAVDHGISAAELRSWLQQTFLTELGTRNAVHEAAPLTAGMPNAVARALRDRHILTAFKRSGARWYELEHDCLIDPIRHGRGQDAGEVFSRLGPVDFLRAAELAIADGDLELAERHAVEILRSAEEKDLKFCAEAEVLRGNIAYSQGRPIQAEARYRAAAEMFETLQDTSAVAGLLAAIGQTLLAQEKRAEAVNYLHASVGRIPNDLTVQTELAWALWYVGRQRAAVAVLTSVLAIDGTAYDALRARGEILADLGDAEGALRDLDLVRRHQRPSSLAARGLALATLRRTSAADPEIDAALSRAPDSGPVLLYAARVAALVPDPVTAVNLARRAVNATDPAVPPHQRVQAMRILESALLPLNLWPSSGECR